MIAPVAKEYRYWDSTLALRVLDTDWGGTNYSDKIRMLKCTPWRAFRDQLNEQT